MEIRSGVSGRSDAGQPVAWQLAYLDVAEADARKFLTQDQYAHAVSLFEALAMEQNPRLSDTQDVRAIDEFHELRDKGGILGRINLRIYFAVLDELHTLLVLGAYKKEDQGQTPPYVIAKMRNRLRTARNMLAR